MSEPILAWHWVVRNEKGVLKLRNGRNVPPVGVPLEYKGKVKMCARGLHASRRAVDALGYIPYNATVLCRVRCEDVVEEWQDKLVCRKRTVLATFDCEKLVHEFACRCVERALKKANVTDERSWNAIKVKRAWLKGEATDGELGKAWVAASDAEWEAPIGVKYDAAQAALDVAAREAWRAARAANVATAWQEAELLSMLKEAGWDGL